MRRSPVDSETPPPPRRGAHHIAVISPGTYAESASSLGVHFLLRSLRSRPGFSAGRFVYTRGRGEPLSLEDRLPLGGFPLILASVAWELQVEHLTEILGRASIPALAKDRDGGHPVVIAGGALTLSSPHLLEPVSDVVVRGDGEDAIDAFLDSVPAATSRADVILALHGLPGTSPGTRATCSPERLPVGSAFTSPGSAYPSMHLVEVMRGCPHGCTFCIMSARRLGRPRYVPAEAVLAAIPEGVGKVGLVGPSVLDHPRIDSILASLADRGLEAGISSARADLVDGARARLLASLGLRTLTIALDGASTRIRDSIRKRIAGEDVVRASRLARSAGIGRIKLYVMLGFPGEDDTDVDELAGTCSEIASQNHLTVSLGPLVPKRGTPLESASFVSREDYESRVRRLRSALGRRATIDSVPWREARAEADLSR